ncbi:hypothetical protein [Rhizobium sophoriradicis]|uniref:hypothetical protein n=1 Tax=Rhizobium sophoriradicis TaxID=1535245 RepID=UPI001FE0FA3A|nr:hypothetical protein [Rhizobium sophoriradicis]
MKIALSEGGHRIVEIGEIVVDRRHQFIEHRRRTPKIRVRIVGIHSPRQIAVHGSIGECRDVSAESGLLILKVHDPIGIARIAALMRRVRSGAVHCLDHAPALAQHAAVIGLATNQESSNAMHHILFPADQLRRCRS